MAAPNKQDDSIGVAPEPIQQSTKKLLWLDVEEMVDPRVINIKTTVLSSEVPKNNQDDFEEQTGGSGSSTFPNYYSLSWWNSEGPINKVRLWSKKYARHMIFGHREVLRSHEGRHIELDISRNTPLIDERTGKHYIKNTIRSSRYTIWTFLPMQLWFQFTKIANFYFLIMGILQLIPGLSTTGTYTTILPLLFFLSFSIAREGYDDFRRYRLDRVENRRLARVLDDSSHEFAERESICSLVKIVRKSWEELKKITGWYGVTDPIEAIEEVLEINSYSGAKESSAMAASPESEDSAPCSWASVKWIDLKVGDVIEVKRNEQVPADIVLFYADGRDGIAYVETMALDGETNLKCRRPPHQLAQQSETLTDLARCRAQFAVEDPNLDLYEFHGKVSIDDETLPLTLENVIFRGSILRNTRRTIGMIVNTGEECKIRMNANKNPQTKAPAIQHMTNQVVILLAAFVVLLSISCTAGYEIWTPVFEARAWYLEGGHLPLDDILIAFAIEFNNLIPLALYVSLEMIKFAQFLLLQDIEMYDPVSNTPMVSNTQTIYENLGQVSYIFSDKTGTLTENVMRFRKMSVAGTAWRHKNCRVMIDEDQKIKNGHTNLIHRRGEQPVPQTAKASALSDSQFFNQPSFASSILQNVTLGGSSRDLYTDELLRHIQIHPATAFASKVQIFLLALSLCHTCFPEVQTNGQIGFQATSPDELALVGAAQELGHHLVDRSAHSIALLTHPAGPDSSVRKTYEILDVIEFSTKRKRMSIILRFPDGRICLFCKGADSAVLPRLKSSSKIPQFFSQTGPRSGQCIDEVNVARLRRSMQDGSMSNLERLSLSLPRMEKCKRSASFVPSSIAVKADPHCSRNGHGKVEEPPPTFTGGSREYSLPSGEIISNSRCDAQTMIEKAEFFENRAVFKFCHQHINEFACEGLRTLVYGYRFIDPMEYDSWRKIYQKATTSLTKRQEMIEEAGELIEQNLDLAGATAIEDKLQKGVPETIDKLQRANIKIWMLTGDKLETAINIAHSARICKPYSQVVVLDQVDGDIEQQIASTLVQVSNDSHIVVVIDGQTLVEIEKKVTLESIFYELLLHVDSVICCRASPSQKASMVKKIRQKVPKSITLAIGDGGNDISMIQEAHVGVGISGKEGLQAARVADYSIAQFRFLQRLLLVHGHWNYVRTAKYILLTFWKEMLFYSIQIMYQRWNGYTGTSLYESDSLTVWNTLFTSLPVMLPGIFEQDLSAATLLAVPELYSYGQQSKGFNMRKYGLWMLMAAIESQIIWFMIYGIFGVVPITNDQSLFAIGDLAFSICVVFINVKLLVLQFHYKTWIPLFGATLTISGWWAWNLFLSAIYSNNPGPYTVYHAFTEEFGRNPTWWAVLVAVLAVVILLEVVVEAARRRWWPSLVDIWQELEKVEGVKRRLVESGGEGGYGVRIDG